MSLFEWAFIVNKAVSDKDCSYICQRFIESKPCPFVSSIDKPGILAPGFICYDTFYLGCLGRIDTCLKVNTSRTAVDVIVLKEK
jgi:hypothetical protein